MSHVFQVFKKPQRHIHTQNCEAVWVSKTLSFRRTDIWSLTYSLTWLDLEPNSPATTSSSASRSVAARTFCRSCCCSSFVENAKSSSSMPASLVITCRAEGTLLFSPPWPDPTFSWAHLVWSAPHSGPAEKLPNNRELLSGSAEPSLGSHLNKELSQGLQGRKGSANSREICSQHMAPK